MSYFKKFLIERDRGLYDDLVGNDPSSVVNEPEDTGHSEPKTSEKSHEKKGMSRRAFLGGAAAAAGLEIGRAHV